MIIPVIIEPIYDVESIWCAETRIGLERELSRKKYSLLEIDPMTYTSYDYQKLPRTRANDRLVVLIGTSPKWISQALAFLSDNGVGVLLVSCQPPENAQVRGVVRIDYAAGIGQLLAHLSDCGCERPALYGCYADSSADLIKRWSFAERLGPNAQIFENHGSLADCANEFISDSSYFDSVICANDIAAASLIQHLHAAGIRIPRDIQVVCFGSSEISRLFSPSITSLTLDNTEVGQQTVMAYAYLAKTDGDVNISVRVRGKLIIRESSCVANTITAAEQPLTHEPVFTTGFYDDHEVQTFTRLERILLGCDTIDREILRLISTEVTTEKIAEQLSLAVETVRYRIRRILSNAGLKTRAELLSFITGSGFGEVITEQKTNQA